MENYRLSGNEYFYMIGQEAGAHIDTTPGIREIKFVKVDGNEIKYNTYVLEGSEIPVINGAELIDTCPREGLEDTLFDALNEESLPQEVRVIKPNHERDAWDIFFKQ